MAGTLTEKELENLDRQTLASMLTETSAALLSLKEKFEDVCKMNVLLSEEVANLRAKRFGRSSEAGLTKQVEGQMELDLGMAFNEAEKTVESSPSPAEPGIEETVKSYKRLKKVGKRSRPRAARLPGGPSPARRWQRSTGSSAWKILTRNFPQRTAWSGGKQLPPRSWTISFST
jgi:hypothetical protein